MECWYDWLQAWAWQPPRPYPALDCQREMQAFQGQLHILDVPWEARADDAAISAAGGCGIIRVNPFAGEEEEPSTQKARAAAIDGWLAQFSAELRGE